MVKVIEETRHVVVHVIDRIFSMRSCLVIFDNVRLKVLASQG